MSQNKVEQKSEEEISSPKLSQIELKMKEIYLKAIPDKELRGVVTHNILARTEKVVSRIAGDEEFFPRSTEEVDLKPLIRKWRGMFMKDEIKNYALNHLYVTDTSMGKKDLERNLKILNDNIDVMGTTDGFQKIERQIGLDNKLLQKSSTVSALKPMKELEPFCGKKETYFDKRSHLNEEQEKHLANANHLMDKIKEEKKHRKERMKEIRKKRREAKDKREQSKFKRMEEEEEKKRVEAEQKEKEVQDKINKIHEERKKKIDEMNENTKKIERPRYREIQKDYNKKVLMPILDQKKKMLASIRDLHKPIRLDEINEHKRRIDEVIEQKKREWEENAPKDDFSYKKLQTNWIKAIKERDIEQKEEEERKNGEKKELYDKMRSYGEMVKEMHWPNVSQKKQLEMQLLKESLKHPIKNRLNGSTLSSKHGNNRRSAESLLGLAKSGVQSDIEDAHSNTIKRRKIIWKENPMVPKPPQKKEAQVIDWLQERRKRRMEDIVEGRDIKSSPIRNWQKDIEEYQLTQQEKYEYIRERTKQLEEDAKRKEEMITFAKAGTIEDRDKINDMIFESIKAKLNILEEFNS
jgi:hypothetical protein